jgi:hypothetical protein
MRFNLALYYLLKLVLALKLAGLVLKVSVTILASRLKNYLVSKKY